MDTGKRDYRHSHADNAAARRGHGRSCVCAGALAQWNQPRARHVSQSVAPKQIPSGGCSEFRRIEAMLASALGLLLV
jgi:hypothetical protein